MAVRKEKNRKKWTKDGRAWYFDVYYNDIYGNRKEKKSKYFKTSKEAEQAERHFLNNIEKQAEDNSITISFSTVYEQWLLLEKRRLKSSTFYSKKGRLKLHVLNFFEKYKLHSINVKVITEWYDFLEEKEGDHNYKNKSISDFKKIMTFAVEQYDYNKKIITHIQPYYIEKINNSLTDAEINFWTYEQFTHFIATVDDFDYYVYFYFLYYTGLRLGEFLALTWKKYNPRNKTIEVIENLTTKVEGGGYKITTPKTKNSERIVDLDDELNELLLKYKKEQQKIYNFNENMFIFGNVKYIPETTLRRKLDYYIKKSKLNKRITPHGFRHSHVSLLINLGCDSRDVAERIGDTVEMVEKTYYHMFPKKKKETVEKLNLLKKTR